MVERLVGPAAMSRLSLLADAVVAENEHQNLIARSTIPAIWARHILDSVQLLRWAGLWNTWLDIGTGGGFPGLVIAATTMQRTILVEPRRRRAEFLVDVAARLGLAKVEVVKAAVANVSPCRADIISARAVGSLATLFSDAHHCAMPSTTWILPRGSCHQEDVRLVGRDWTGLFHVEQSLTDDGAGIVVARGVVRR